MNARSQHQTKPAEGSMPDRQSPGLERIANLRLENSVSNRALSLSLSGAPLEPQVRTEMEARFGESFADVRIHDDPQAHRLAAQLDAKAYTVGNHVAFSGERYAPDTSGGKRLLAHELAHVVQQRRGGHPPSTAPDAPHEAAADQVAARVVSGAPRVTVPGATSIGVARAPDDQHRNKKPPGKRRAPKPKGKQPAFEAAFDPLPHQDAARELEPGPKYWLRHSPDVTAMSLMQLKDEANQIGEFLDRQVATTPDVLRLEQVKARLLAAAATRTDDAHQSPSRTEQQLALRARVRHVQLVDQALSGGASTRNPNEQLLATMRRIDSIKPLPEKPGFYYVTHNNERIVLSEEMVRAVRAGAQRTLTEMANDIPDSNHDIRSDYDEFVDRTYEKHPIIGAISMLRSWENPLDWRDVLEGLIAVSNNQWGRFHDQLRDARDPWRADPASLARMAETVLQGQRLGDAARTYLDYKTDQVLTGTAGAVDWLAKWKTAGQVAANFAFTPLGAAFYGAGESALVQTAEIHYGQRESFDTTGIAFDFAANYFGAKVAGKVGGLAGDSAPLWKRALTFVAADRASAASTRAARMGLDKLTGRGHASYSDIFHASTDEALDWRQAALNLVLVGVAHSAGLGPGGAASRPAKAPRVGKRTQTLPPVTKSVAANTKLHTTDANLAPEGGTQGQTPVPRVAPSPKSNVPSRAGAPQQTRRGAAAPVSTRAAPRPTATQPPPAAAGRQPAKRPAGSVKPERTAQDSPAAAQKRAQQSMAADPIEARLRALEVPSGKRAAFNKAANEIRKRATADPEAAERILEGLEERFGSGTSHGGKTAEVLDQFREAQKKQYPYKDPAGKFRQSPAADERALQEQPNPSRKVVRKAAIRESERLGVAGGQEQAAREGITVRDWETPQQFKGDYGKGPDALGERGDRRLLLEFKGGGSSLGESSGVVEMSNEWVGRKIAELASVGDRQTAAELLRAARQGKLQGLVYRTRQLAAGEKTSRLKGHQLRDHLRDENISESGLIRYSPTKVVRAYLKRRQELRKALREGNLRALKNL